LRFDRKHGLLESDIESQNDLTDLQKREEEPPERSVAIHQEKILDVRADREFKANVRMKKSCHVSPFRYRAAGFEQLFFIWAS
jgi:hypothetical protein